MHTLHARDAKVTLPRLKRSVRSGLRFLTLPLAAQKEARRDWFGSPRSEVGPWKVAELGIQWLCSAQDRSTSNDGGVARHYSLISGWSDSYPETTGYIAPTLLSAAKSGVAEASSMKDRVRRMLDWLVSIQFADGSFPGGTVSDKPQAPVVFNTGQILLGLSAGVQEFGDTYSEASRRAADWLAENQDTDGCWRAYPSPFAAPIDKTYDVHVAWGLLEAARVHAESRYADVALANVEWALTHQHANGWFEKCCLSDPNAPLTHTIGYTLRGILEAYRYTKDDKYLKASQRTADGVYGAIDRTGFLPGRLDRNWRKMASWACLTGTAQIACCWLLLFQMTGDRKYLDSALVANRYVRRTVKSVGDASVCGAVKGSFPVYGQYGAYQFLNWACKFVVDANILELSLHGVETR